MYYLSLWLCKLLAISSFLDLGVCVCVCVCICIYIETQLFCGWRINRKYFMRIILLYILESNPHPNLIRTSFCRFLKFKKKLVHSSNPHLSFNQPLPTRQTDWIILDITNALKVIRLTCRVWSGHLTASSTNVPQLMIVTWWWITIQFFSPLKLWKGCGLDSRIYGIC